MKTFSGLSIFKGEILFCVKLTEMSIVSYPTESKVVWTLGTWGTFNFLHVS